ERIGNLYPTPCISGANPDLSGPARPFRIEIPCFFPVTGEIGARRPVQADCVHHQVVRASAPGFPDGRVARYSRGLAGEGGVCDRRLTALCAFYGLLPRPVSAAKIPFPGAMVRVRCKVAFGSADGRKRLLFFQADFGFAAPKCWRILS